MSNNLEEIRELNKENRALNRENRQLNKENRELYLKNFELNNCLNQRKIKRYILRNNMKIVYKNLSLIL